MKLFITCLLRHLFLVLVIFSMTAALPSCKALEGVPIRIGIQTPDADFGYSSKSGLVVSGRVPVQFPVTREK